MSRDSGTQTTVTYISGFTTGQRIGNSAIWRIFYADTTKTTAWLSQDP